MPDLDLIDTPARAVSLLDPMRLRMMELLREPGSAAGVARTLGLPRQKVNYHLRELEKQGLVREVEQRRKGNCVERVVQATARSYLVSPAALGVMGTTPEQIADRFSAAYLMALAARTIRDLATVQALAGAAGKRVATLSYTSELRFRSAAERNAFAEELGAALIALVARYHHPDAPGGRWFTVTTGAYPSAPKQEATR